MLHTFTHLEEKELREIKAEYRNSWILAIILFLLSILFPIITFITAYEFKLEISVFSAFPLVHLWWFVPAQVGYLPFFHRDLIYHPKLMKKIFWFMLLWPALILILMAIDYASNLWVTKALFLSVSFVSGTLFSIIALVVAVLQPLFSNKLLGFMNKVDVEVLGTARERAIVIGLGEMFYDSPKVLQKGLPIVIRNRTKRAVVVSHVILGVTTLNIPLSFRTRSGASAIEYSELWTLPKWVIVQSESSQILYIPWRKVVKASLKAQEITQKIGRRPRFHVGIHDPFPNRQFWSKEINHLALLAEISHLEWIKKPPEWGKRN